MPGMCVLDSFEVLSSSVSLSEPMLNSSGTSEPSVRNCRILAAPHFRRIPVGKEAVSVEKKTWSVYMVKCADGSLYTGITTNVDQRIEDHNSNNRRAAKYTKGRRPVILVYQEDVNTRSQAARREQEVKRLTKRQKETLIQA